jgi:hypothetical protein
MGVIYEEDNIVAGRFRFDFILCFSCVLANYVMQLGLERVH